MLTGGREVRQTTQIISPQPLPVKGLPVPLQEGRGSPIVMRVESTDNLLKQTARQQVRAADSRLRSRPMDALSMTTSSFIYDGLSM